MSKSMFLNLVKIYIVGALFVCSNAFATTYSLPCGECGNSTEARVINTAIFLATVADKWGNNVIKPNDQVKIIADDGTNAVYKKYTQYAGIRWGCVAQCTQLDNNERLIAPVMGSTGGGGEVDSGSPVYFDGGDAGWYGNFDPSYFGYFGSGGSVTIGPLVNP